jgi:hypothetical protein
VRDRLTAGERAAVAAFAALSAAAGVALLADMQVLALAGEEAFASGLVDVLRRAIAG